jgi:PAS domain S-box-containing protein
MEPVHKQSVVTQAMTRDNANPRPGLGARPRTLPLYILTFLLLAAAVVGFIGYDLRVAYRNTLAYWQARQSSAADNGAHRVSDWLAEREEDVQLVAAHPLVRASLRARQARRRVGAAYREGLSELTAALDQVMRLYPYAGVYVLDRDAAVVAHSNHSAPLDASLGDACKAVARGGALRIEVRGDAPQRSLVAFIAPAYPGTPPESSGQTPQRAAGVVLTLLDPAKTLFRLVRRESVTTQTGETILVRREGNDLVCFSPLRHIPACSLNRRFPLSAAPLPARLALEGRETFMEYNDYRGVPVLAAARNIPLAGWGMVRKIDRAEALADFRGQVKVETLAGVLLIILLGGLLLFHRREVVTAVLKEEGAKFKALFELAPEAIYMIEPSTLRILARNRKAAEMDGYSDDEVARMTMLDLHPPEERHLAPHRLENPPEPSEALPTQTLHHMRKGGKLVPVEESQGPVGAGEQRFWLSIVRDISERQRAEESLRKAEEEYRKIFEEALEGIYRVSPEGKSRAANPALARMLGYGSVEEAVASVTDSGHQVWVNPNDRLAYRKQLEEQGVVRGYEVQHRRKDGTIIWVSLNSRKVCGPNGRTLYYEGFIEDITERKRAEAELAERLRFETLLADLSARFVNVPAQQFDDEIEDTLRRVCECVALEAASLWQASAENPSLLTLTHRHRPPGRPPLPQRMDAQEYFPWCYQQFMAGRARVFAFSSLEEVPAEAARDRETWRQFGVKSSLIIALSVGGGPPVGALSFNTMRAERIWSEEMVNRLQLVAQMFSNALARQRSDQALRESEERYRTLFENAPVGIYRSTPEGRLLVANPHFVRMLGYSSFEELAAGDLNIESTDRDYPRRRFKELVEKKEGVTSLESTWRRRDGRVVHIRENARAVRDDSGRILYYEGTVEDITPQKEAQQRQDLTVRVLDILNRAGSLSAMIGEILRVIREHTGFDAVGIRLREGEDFPYFVQEGFSKGFAEKENYLCSRTPEGALRCDEQGHPILECTCGLVLRRRTDPANPLFTVGGSFWTNRLSRLLELTSERDTRRHPCSRCAYEGYESVALIPIRVGQEIAGLLQLADRRWDRFTVNAIRFFEGIGASIGLALARQREAEALRQSEQFNREVISNAQEGVIVYDREFRYLVWNRFMEELTSMPAAQVLGKNAFDLFPHLREQNLEPLIRRALAGETVQSHDAPFYVRETGKSGWTSNTYGPHFGPDGEIIGVIAIVRQISKRKQAEEETRQALEQLRALAARLQTIREEERTRVAREIHDQLGQALTAIKLELSSLAREFTAEQSQQWKRASSLLKLVDQTIQSVRRISTELRPGMLDDLGLVATVEWATREFVARTGTKCLLDLPEEHIALDSETATAVFRILQETLANVGRHANASEVKVRLAKQAGDLTLEVRDNGRGITEGEASSAGSLGILGMRERALLLRGELTVSGAPEKGTTVSVRIPSAYRKERE